MKMEITPETTVIYLQHEYKYRKVYIILKRSLFV